MRIHYLQHDPAEGAGSIEEWALSRGHSLSATRLFADEALPDVGDIDWLFVMGGPMNVYQVEQYPWLAREKKFIEATVAAAKPTVGICLGAQLIADVLGARVRRNEYSEIGWFPVQMTTQARESQLFSALPEQLTVLHWHGDTFELPAGAAHIARSEACANQAFTFRENVIGLQFHLELTRAGTQALLESCVGELGQGPYVQQANELTASEDRFARSNSVLAEILDRLAHSCQSLPGVTDAPQ